MAEAKHWYVICYDITEPKRWRAVYKKLHGYGRRLQYLKDARNPRLISDSVKKQSVASVT
jgi:CRISPR associated protein Cas2